jgi:hypothetical protein
MSAFWVTQVQKLRGETEANIFLFPYKDKSETKGKIVQPLQYESVITNYNPGSQPDTILKKP